MFDVWVRAFAWLQCPQVDCTHLPCHLYQAHDKRMIMPTFLIKLLKMSLLFSIQAFGATPFGFSDHLCDIRRRRISVTALAKLLISFAAKDALSWCRSRRGSLASFLSASELHSISYEYKYGPLLQGGLDFGPLTRLHEIQSLWVWV